MMSSAEDTVFEENGQWYFKDEDGDAWGPFDTESLARQEYKIYTESSL